MAKIKVASVPKQSISATETLATLCYYYPQYTFAHARKLPARDVNLLLKVAMKQESIRYYNQVQIAAAPHTKNAKGVSKLMAHFRSKFNG